MAVHIRTGHDYSGLWYGPEMETQVAEYAAAKRRSAAELKAAAVGEPIKPTGGLRTAPRRRSTPRIEAKPVKLLPGPATPRQSKAAAVPDCHIIQSGRLREILDRTIYAADPYSSRYSLQGVYLDVKPDGITFVSTDTRRLVVLPESSQATCEPIYGTAALKPLKALVKLLPKGKAAFPVRVEVTHKEARFTLADRSEIVPLVEGRFPQWEKVLPEVKDFRFDTTLTAGELAEQLVKVIPHAEASADPEERHAKFCFCADLLLLKAHNGAAFGCKVSACGEFTVKLDPRFVNDFVKRLPPGEPVRIRGTDDTSAVQFEALGMTYLVMPIGRG